VSPRARAGKPVLYFSFRSPYSWLAVERLRGALPDLHDRIDFIPAWNPDAEVGAELARRNSGFRYVEMSTAKQRYILADIRRLVRKAGLTLTWPIDDNPHWELPNLVWLAGRRAGIAEPLYTALVTARWHQGTDICDAQELWKAVSRARLDADALFESARSPGIREEGIRCLMSAWDDDVFGFPYLLHRRQRFWGLDRVPDFLETLDLPGGNPPPETQPSETPDPASIPGFDEDAAGGCG
jgi:2-hydroxychromene-2-carboxylate isomerase